jgi:hypothetical protein
VDALLGRTESAFCLFLVLPFARECSLAQWLAYGLIGMRVGVLRATWTVTGGVTVVEVVA